MNAIQHSQLRVVDHIVDMTAHAAHAPRAKVLQILGIFPGLDNTATRTTRLFLVLVGFLPVTLIAASTFDLVGLRELATYLLVPAVLVTGIVACQHRWTRHLIFRAMVVGALATGMYDLIRFGFIWTGFMHSDPIPHIGMDLHLSPAWVVGYLWRYLGNGAGLSIAFFSLGLIRLRHGLMFGFFVAIGLISVLIVSPNATRVLWPVNTISVLMIISGHLAFGAGLAAFHHFIEPSTATSSATVPADSAARPDAAPTLVAA